MLYKDAMSELQKIVRQVESAEVDVDELATAVRDANRLVSICRQKLKSAETEVARALEDVGKSEPVEA